MDNSSGQGPLAAVPPEVDRWNWGAFLLNWIWGIAHNTWIALLMFVPGVNFVMPFVLGARGSLWAWRNRSWESVGHFRRAQRAWALWGVGLLLAGLVVVAAALWWVMTAITDSEPYRLAIHALATSREAASELGEPIEPGVPRGGFRIAGGAGRADLEVPVAGPRGRGTVFLDARMEGGAWRLERLELVIGATGRRIDLAPPAARGDGT